jgi:hypothetical protein
MLRFHTNLRKVTGSFLLALVVWFAASPVAKAFSPDSQCGTQCCRAKRAKKSCCCRKQPPPTHFRYAISAHSCPPGCGQAATLPAAQFAPARLAPLPAFVLASAARYALPALFPASSTLCFALQQRPPPVSPTPTY